MGPGPSHDPRTGASRSNSGASRRRLDGPKTPVSALHNGTGAGPTGPGSETAIPGEGGTNSPVGAPGAIAAWRLDATGAG
jgi:hypothetical protein